MQENQNSLRQKIELVAEFHRAFSVLHHDSPQLLANPEDWKLRHRLMAEENDEYLMACETGDLVAIADALGDMLYVLCGSIVTHGLQDYMAPIFDEIHASNMSKLDENGHPILREDGKVLKSKGYFRPDLKKILQHVLE